jgi:HD-GYP domain-containing protein (c-di-GMP phosphodiesterase class II)
MVAALASALAARDPLTAAHSTRVTFLADRLAVWLGWGEDRLSSLRAGVPLHDIGKLNVAPAILRKRGPLDEHELAEIRTHPVAGARLLAESAPEAVSYVLYHHERWDGGGYPTGRAGHAIPEGARLLSVVDAYDAMTSTRPYRRALPTTRALSEIGRCAGTQFDPYIARAFLEAWSAGAFTELTTLQASSASA